MTIYNPDREDVVAYSILPAVGYIAVLIGAIALPVAPRGALFVIAGGTVLLVFIGIRNAWDVVTYLVVSDAQGASPADDANE